MENISSKSYVTVHYFSKVLRFVESQHPHPPLPFQFCNGVPHLHNPGRHVGERGFLDVGMVDGGDVLADGERQFGDEVQVGGERRMRAGEFGKQRFGVEQDGFNVSGCGAGTGALFASGLACAGQQGDDVFSSLRVVGAHDVSNLSCDGLGYGPDGRYALFNFKFAPARPFRPLSSNPKNVRGA